MIELIKYFNEKYGKEYGNVEYPKTTIQIYKTYQIIKSCGIADTTLLQKLNKIVLPTPKTIEEREMYAECIYESVSVPASRKYVDKRFEELAKSTSVENGKIFLVQEDGNKIDTGTELPTIKQQIGEKNDIQIFTELTAVEITFPKDKTIVQSLDNLIDKCNPQLNQVYRGQSYAKDNPISGNCEIEISVLKSENSGSKDIVCQIVLSSTTNAPYKWIMVTRRSGDATSSTVDVSLRPWIPDVNKAYVDSKIPKMSFNDNGELVITIGSVTKTFAPKTEETGV